MTTVTAEFNVDCVCADCGDPLDAKTRHGTTILVDACETCTRIAYEEGKESEKGT
jgi:hypothetical protein